MLTFIFLILSCCSANPDDHFFLAIYASYEVPILIDGVFQPLLMHHGFEIQEAKHWCSMHFGNNSDSCVDSVLSKASYFAEQHRKDSDIALGMTAWTGGAPLTVERPLSGELFFGPSPFASVVWAPQGPCAHVPPGGGQAKIVAYYRPIFVDDGDEIILFEDFIGLNTGRWEGYIGAFPGSSNDLGATGILCFDIVITGDNGHSEVNCHSVEVQVSHSSTHSTLVAVERGDRGGAVAHTTLIRHAIKFNRT